MKIQDLSTTYLGRIGTTTASNIKAEERFLMSEQSYMIVKLLDRTECQILLDTGASKCQILLDTGASKSFISKSHYLQLQILTFIAKVCIKNTETFK